MDGNYHILKAIRFRGATAIMLEIQKSNIDCIINERAIFEQKTMGLTSQ